MRRRTRRAVRQRATEATSPAAPLVAELEITAIAAGGSGVGRHEGMVAFVPRTAPGDRIKADLLSKGRFAEGRMLELLEPSPERVLFQLWRAPETERRTIRRWARDERAPG